jgi:sec-independent protein translocase protein TatB
MLCGSPIVVTLDAYAARMFDSIGWGEILVLVVAGLFILGPERLPAAATWLGRTIHQVRSYATGASAHIREELGPEFDDLRQPHAEMKKVRGWDPRRMAFDALLQEPSSPTDKDGVSRADI